MNKLMEQMARTVDPDTCLFIIVIESYVYNRAVKNAGMSRLEKLDRWQRRWPPAAFLVGVGKRYAEDGTARQGARIAYYAFFSVFPLMLAFVSILGFALEGDLALRQDILDSAYADMPVIGPFIRSDVDAIGGSGIALAVGIAVALWAGLGVTVALGQALDRVWGVAPVEQLSWTVRRLRGLAMIVVGGLGLIASSALGGLAASGALAPALTTVASFVLSFALDACILLGAFRLLTAARPPVRDLLPGVLAAAVGLLVLQALGGWYVESTIGRATDTYGLFATVIGLLSWLSLAAQVVLIAAEIAAVRALGLWPRSLGGPMTAADRRALEGYAVAARYDPRAEITVRWEDP
jgi:membrane protein